MSDPSESVKITAPSAHDSLGGMLGRFQRAKHEILSNPRARREAAWVLGHKLIEFLLVFAGLKLFTNLMTLEAFGEFNLALTAVGLLSDATAMPIAHAFYRTLSHGGAEGRRSHHGVSFLRWYAAATIAVALAVALMNGVLSKWLHIGTWTALATACLFLVNRWRALGVELLDMRRNRRASTLNNLGFIALQTVLVATAAYHWPAGTAWCLGGYAVAALVFAMLGTLPLVPTIASSPAPKRAPLWPMIAAFGIPYGALLVCQWIQNFAERYVLGIRLDLDAVGVYVAAYQVCGVPYMLFASVFNGLAVPIAYERAGDATDPVRLSSADQVLIVSVVVYLVLGVLMIPFYALWGGWAMRVLTNASLSLPQGVLICLALARFIQCLGFVVQPFFAVHQRMGASLVFRIVGAVAVVPICWVTIGRYGIAGAGVGALVSGVIYITLMFAGPGGCLHLIRQTRRDRRAVADSS